MTSPAAPETSDDRPKRGANPRLKTSTTLIAIPGVAEGGTTTLVNLSTTGACVELETTVEKGQSFELKLAHPRLGVVPALSGEVMWVAPGRSSCSAFGLKTQRLPAVRCGPS